MCDEQTDGRTVTNNMNIEYINIMALLFGCSDYDFKMNEGIF